MAYVLLYEFICFAFKDIVNFCDTFSLAFYLILSCFVISAIHVDKLFSICKRR